jgi:hypothetical protein
MVIQKELSIPAEDFIMYVNPTDDPFDIIDVTHPARGQTYKFSYRNLHSDLLIAYYTGDYSSYVPIYVGRADPQLAPHSVPEITISERARPGSYFFTHAARSAVSREDRDLPVFGYKVIE